MAASKRPSFLKRQKEQARVARASEKRDAKRERKHAKANRDALVENSDMADSPDDVIADDDRGDETPLA